MLLVKEPERDGRRRREGECGGDSEGGADAVKSSKSAGRSVIGDVASELSILPVLCDVLVFVDDDGDTGGVRGGI